MMCRVLILFAVFHLYSSGQTTLHTWKKASEQLRNETKQHASTTLLPTSKKLKVQRYIFQLYKTLTNGPRRLPFGAQFVRSFTGTGKTTKMHTLMDFDVRIPKGEKILYAILHFCVQHRIPKEVSALKVTDILTGKTITKTSPELRYGRCFRNRVTNMLIARRKPSAEEIPMIVQISMRGQLGKLWFNWNAELSDLKEMIVFSKEVQPASPLLGLSLKVNSRVIKRREVVEKSTVEGRSMKKGCNRESLIVNFESLGYRNIIAPTIFDAGQCVGKCKYPLGKLSNPTQHSLIQQLLHSLYGNSIAKSTCCAPRGFLPLTTMIEDKYSGGVAIRSLEDIIVSDCGCV